jgi:hypothetical protein
MLSPVISLLIVLALVTVPLALIARLSLTVLARMLGVTSQSEVATRAEFARIREQLLARAGDGEEPVRNAPHQPGATATQATQAADALGHSRTATLEPSGETPETPEPNVARWHRCPTCEASVPSTARICLQCGARLSAQR